MYKVRVQSPIQPDHHTKMNASFKTRRCPVLVGQHRMWLWLALAAVLPRQAAAQVGITLCACQPSTYTMTFRFNLTCDDIDVAGPGIAQTNCSDSNTQVEGGDVTPVRVTAVDILELDQNLGILVQTPKRGTYQDGAIITYTSVIATQPLDDLESFNVPRGIQFNLVGFNSQDQFIEQRVIILYDNDCGVFPLLFEGQVAGWLEFTDLGDPPSRVCPLAATEAPTAAPAVSTATDAPSFRPTAAPQAPPVTVPPVEPPQTPPVVPKKTCPPVASKSSKKAKKAKKAKKSKAGKKEKRVKSAKDGTMAKLTEGKKSGKKTGKKSGSSGKKGSDSSMDMSIDTRNLAETEYYGGNHGKQLRLRRLKVGSTDDEMSMSMPHNGGGKKTGGKKTGGKKPSSGSKKAKKAKKAKLGKNPDECPEPGHSKKSKSKLSKGSKNGKKTGSGKKTGGKKTGGKKSGSYGKKSHSSSMSYSTNDDKESSTDSLMSVNTEEQVGVNVGSGPVPGRSDGSGPRGAAAPMSADTSAGPPGAVSTAENSPSEAPKEKAGRTGRNVFAHPGDANTMSLDPRRRFYS